jgi:hypothetical protein
VESWWGLWERIVATIASTGRVVANLDWTLGDRVVDTTLRLDEPTAFDAALASAGIPERQTP